MQIRRRSFRVAAGAATIIAIVVTLSSLAVLWMIDCKLHRHVGVPRMGVLLTIHDGSRERGQHLFVTRGCATCHGLRAVGAAYRDEDWIALLRYGVKMSGEPLLLMPSADYARLTDDDIGALATYVRSLSPQPSESMEIRLPYTAQLLYLPGLRKDAAQTTARLAPLPPLFMLEESSIRYGEYVSPVCTRCHGAELRDALRRYRSKKEFRRMMRTGERPDGSAIARLMPFEVLGQLDDAELDALFLYLKSRPG